MPSRSIRAPENQNVTFVGVFVIAAARTFVVPRSSANILSGLVFRPMRRIFHFIASRLPTYEQRDGLMALYAPLSLLLLVPFWLMVTAVGFGMIYWAMGITPWQDAFIASGSSLLTLGYVGYDTLVFHLFSFMEATIGLMLVAMLIAYLPTMYSAFQQREAAVSLLEVRAGTPPTAAELIWRLLVSNRRPAIVNDFGNRGNKFSRRLTRATRHCRHWSFFVHRARDSPGLWRLGWCWMRRRCSNRPSTSRRDPTRFWRFKPVEPR